MIHFVGAGPGAPDLITLRGVELLKTADTIVYAGSLVNPALLNYAKNGCELHNSAEMTLEEVLTVLLRVHHAGGMAVRLHTGDPSVYGAIREQMDALQAAEAREHDRIDARCAGHHLPYEALMPRDVDNADDPVVRKDQRRKPKLDGNAPFLFLFEAVAIHPRERFDERRLSVIDMPRRAEDERNFLL